MSSWLTSLGLEAAPPHPAVVRIVATERGALAQGSGTLVGVSEQHGLILTNWHVIRDAAGPITVVFPDGYQSAAQILRVDQDWDLAALLIWRPQAQPVAVANAPPRPGETLTIAGYGSGSYRAASGRCTQYVAPGQNMPYEMVEVSASARQGDSGGPIFNERGELAGVLFGSSGGTTSGSYCGRVRSFLQPLWPELGRPRGPSPATGTGQPSQPQSPPTPPAAEGLASLPPPPVASEADGDEEIGSTSGFVSGPPSSFDHVSAPRVDLSPPDAPDSWERFVGNTPAEQAKTALAGIGLLAILMQLARWGSSGEKKKGEGQ